MSRRMYRALQRGFGLILFVVALSCSRAEGQAHEPAEVGATRSGLALEHVVSPPSTPSERPPILLLLHGYGSNEEDLLRLGRSVDPRLLVVSVRAPISVGRGRYAWYPLDWSGGAPTAKVEDMRRARGPLVDYLEALPEAVGGDPERLFLMGFSQGSMMSLEMAALGVNVAGVVALSGRAPLALLERDPAKPCALPPVFMAHGVADPVIPVAKARALRDALSACDVDLSYQEIEGMKHQIAAATRRDLALWLKIQLEGG